MAQYSIVALTPPPCSPVQASGGLMQEDEMAPYSIVALTPPSSLPVQASGGLIQEDEVWQVHDLHRDGQALQLPPRDACTHTHTQHSQTASVRARIDEGSMARLERVSQSQLGWRRP